MRLILVFISLLVFLNYSAQVGVIIDKTTRQALCGVLVYSNQSNKSQQTNEQGQFDTSVFSQPDTIYFSLVGYTALVYKYDALKQLGFKVEIKANPISLSEIIVSFNRWEEDKKEISNRISTVNTKDVIFQNPQTTADLLGISGYAFIQKSQLGGGSPMLRGMATNRVLLVVDGVRMNNAIFRAGNLQNVISLDANALENTEIFFGPGSVVYGSDAIGGVMDFQTLNPKFSGTNRLVASGKLLMRTSTANSEKTGHFNIDVGLKKWAFVTSFTRADYGDLRSGSSGGSNSFYRPYYVRTTAGKDYMIKNIDSTLQIGSGYNQINFMQKIKFKPSTAWDIDYGFHVSETSSYNRYDRLYIMQNSGLYKNKLRWAEWYYGPQKWNMHRVGITHSKTTLLYNRFRVVAAFQNFEESRYDREFMSSVLHMQKENVKAFSLNLDLDKNLNEKLFIYYGAEVVYNVVKSFASLKDVNTQNVNSTVTRYPNGATWESHGAYLSLKYKLSKTLVFNGGVRYSRYAVQANFDTTFFPFPFTSTKISNSAFNGSIGVVYIPIEKWQIYFNASSGFRAPNIDDMSKVFESTPGYLVVPNSNLKPEKAYNMEIGTVKTFGSVLRIDATTYYMLLKDAMERKDYLLNGQATVSYLGSNSRVQAIQNIAQAYVYGVQAGIDFYYNGIGLKSTFSYQQGKEQSGDSLKYYPLRHVAPTFGSTHLTYQRKKIKFDFYIVYNSKMDYEDLALTERVNQSYAKDPKGRAYVESWYTLNFKAAFYFNQYMTITAGIENITNKLYRTYSSGINAPGRNMIISLNAKF